MRAGRFFTPEALEALLIAEDHKERAAIVAWLRQCGSDHEQDGRLSRVAIGKTFAKVADAIERGEHLK